jgi:hypothetical protein
MGTKFGGLDGAVAQVGGSTLSMAIHDFGIKQNS